MRGGLIRKGSRKDRRPKKSKIRNLAMEFGQSPAIGQVREGRVGAGQIAVDVKAEEES